MANEVAAREIYDILEKLRSKGIHVSADWISQCFEYLSIEAGVQLSNEALLNKTFETFLDCDLYESCDGSAFIPANMLDLHKVNIFVDKPAILQIDEALNVGASSMQNTTSAAAKTDPNAPTVACGKPLFKLYLTDGVRQVVALDVHNMLTSHNGTVLVNPGSKLALQNVLVRRGALILSPTSTQILGGEVLRLVKYNDNTTTADETTAAVAEKTRFSAVSPVPAHRQPQPQQQQQSVHPPQQYNNSNSGTSNSSRHVSLQYSDGPSSSSSSSSSNSNPNSSSSAQGAPISDQRRQNQCKQQPQPSNFLPPSSSSSATYPAAPVPVPLSRPSFDPMDEVVEVVGGEEELNGYEEEDYEYLLGLEQSLNHGGNGTGKGIGGGTGGDADSRGFGESKTDDGHNLTRIGGPAVDTCANSNSTITSTSINAQYAHPNSSNNNNVRNSAIIRKMSTSSIRSHFDEEFNDAIADADAEGVADADGDDNGLRMAVVHDTGAINHGATQFPTGLSVSTTAAPVGPVPALDVYDYQDSYQNTVAATGSYNMDVVASEVVDVSVGAHARVGASAGSSSGINNSNNSDERVLSASYSNWYDDGTTATSNARDSIKPKHNEQQTPSAQFTTAASMMMMAVPDVGELYCEDLIGDNSGGDGDNGEKGSAVNDTENVREKGVSDVADDWMDSEESSYPPQRDAAQQQDQQQQQERQQSVMEVVSSMPSTEQHHQQQPQPQYVEPTQERVYRKVAPLVFLSDLPAPNNTTSSSSSSGDPERPPKTNLTNERGYYRIRGVTNKVQRFKADAITLLYDIFIDLDDGQTVQRARVDSALATRFLELSVEDYTAMASVLDAKSKLEMKKNVIHRFLAFQGYFWVAVNPVAGAVVGRGGGLTQQSSSLAAVPATTPSGKKAKTKKGGSGAESEVYLTVMDYCVDDTVDLCATMLSAV